MDNNQKIEQLVNKAGCSSEDAKAALEACGWDMIDAIISLEREGKVKNEAPQQEAEEPVEVIPEIVHEVVTDSSSRRESSGNARNAGNSGSTGKTSGKGRSIWKRIKGILLNNRMMVIKSNGQQILDLPILVPIIALISFFWATLIIAVVAVIFGYRFHFEGADLGKTNINDTMDKATDYAEKVRKDLTGKGNGGQDTDN